MKTILLPLDLGSNTLSLFEYAEPLAKSMDATLLLLHVVRKQSYDNGTFSPKTDVHECVLQQSRMILEQLSQRAIRHGIRAKTMILDGDPAATILNTAKETRAEMIIVRSACGDAQCTSTKVLASASCPVLACHVNHAPPTIPTRAQRDDGNS